MISKKLKLQKKSMKMKNYDKDEREVLKGILLIYQSILITWFLVNKYISCSLPINDNNFFLNTSKSKTQEWYWIHFQSCLEKIYKGGYMIKKNNKISEFHFYFQLYKTIMLSCMNILYKKLFQLLITDIILIVQTIFLILVITQHCGL